MKYKIADIITEYTPMYGNLRLFSAPFIYKGERPVQISLSVTDSQIENTKKRMVGNTSPGSIENFLYSCEFNRAVIKHNAMLIHSSGIICNNGAYLFSAASGVGKSTHTRLWLREFGDVHIFNDDKPVVRIDGDQAIACGTPFDGDSGIALNESAPLKAVVFLERGEHNSVRLPDNKEIIQKLYFQTAHMVSAETAQAMLSNFDELLKSDVRFYVLTCNMEPEAAHVSREAIVK